ncbi:MAG TPA: hypothetical protein VGJ48_03275, partial [Pyrinomonadaceae bacterium]
LPVPYSSTHEGPVTISCFVTVTDQVATAFRSVFVDPRWQTVAYASLSSAGNELQRQTNTEPGAGSGWVRRLPIADFRLSI